MKKNNLYNMIFDQNIILDALNYSILKIDGIGTFKNIGGGEKVAKKDCGEYHLIGLTDTGCRDGYLRYNSDATLLQKEQLTCSESLYNFNVSLVLVVWSNKYTIDSIKDVVLSPLSSNKDFTIKSISEDREKIIKEEKMKANEYELLKVVFDYKYSFTSKCDTDGLECLC